MRDITHASVHKKSGIPKDAALSMCQTEINGHQTGCRSR